MNLALFDFVGAITTGDTSRAIVGGLVLTPVLVAHRLRWISTATTRDSWLGSASNGSRQSACGSWAG
jgi:hypothetical protein